MQTTNNRYSEVIDNRMCLGCGACEYVCGKGNIRLLDFIDTGIRPVRNETDECLNCSACTDVCAGIGTDFRMNVSNEGPFGQEAIEDWGPILEIWEGHATDPSIRFSSSSGGALTALSLYCIEQGDMSGVLHTGQDEEEPSRNRTRLSTSRKAILDAMGSRYSPASVCNGLHLIEQASTPCAFVGKPSEVSSLRKAQKLRPELDAKVGVAMTFFCAETPPTKATLLLSEELGVPERELSNLKYRGDGWPGHFAPIKHGKSEAENKLTYQESWAYLQQYRPWSTQIWPDGGGELADITCGDPWYEQPDGKNPGSSLIIVRTEAGREVVKKAAEAGYLTLSKAELWKLQKSQENLLTKKGSTWGRIAAMKLCGLKAPKHSNINSFRVWLRIPFQEKLRSTLGTIRRIFTKKIYRPHKLNISNSRPVKNAKVVK